MNERGHGMGKWKTDDELFSLARQKLCTAVVGDAMAIIGLQRQFLPSQIRPIAPHMVVIGRAMPVLEAGPFDLNFTSSVKAKLGNPFGLMFEALDALRANEVYVCAGAPAHYASWGELMTTRAMKLGAAGVVLDGYLRDAKNILALNFSAFAYGSRAQNPVLRGKVVDFRCALQIQGTRINPGDILFGDMDGICVVPHQAEEDVFAGAFDMASGERSVQEAIETGMSAAEAFRKVASPLFLVPGVQSQQ